MGNKREVHRKASAAWATLREDLPRANTLNRPIDWVVSPSKSASHAQSLQHCIAIDTRGYRETIRQAR